MKTAEERRLVFIEKARKVHGDKYDYSEVDYKDNRTPVKIIDRNCPENPVFYQTPSNHLKGQDNPFYRNQKISKSNRMEWEELYEKLKASHPNENLEYPKQEVKNFHDKIRIIDHDLRPDGTEYGEYIQEVNAHLKGSGHPQKAIDKSSMKQRLSFERFVEKVKETQPDSDYEFSEAKYTNNHSKVMLYCNKIGTDGKPHGWFRGWAGNLMHGRGCPKCGNQVSHAEEKIAQYVESLGFVAERRNRFNGNMEIDVYVPEKHLGIEFDGLRWHSEQFEKGKRYHISKSEEMAKIGINLIHVFEDEWTEHKEIVLNKIGHLLGVDKRDIKIGARNCTIKQVSTQESTPFLQQFHIQGDCRATVRYGAFYGDKLVGVMLFKKMGNKGEWELVRFCTDTSYGSIPGLGSKLFKRFKEEHDFTIVRTFMDRRWNFSTGENVYTKMGFELDCLCEPDFGYTNGHGERIHKFNFRKHILSKKYGFSMNMTEREMSEELGYYKIWNCGLARYVYRSK